MLKFILRRVLLMIPVLLGVTLVTFIIVRSIPGDPVQMLLGADRRTTPEQIEAIRQCLWARSIAAGAVPEVAGACADRRPRRLVAHAARP